MRRVVFGIGLLVALVAVVAAACGGGEEKAATPIVVEKQVPVEVVKEVPVEVVKTVVVEVEKKVKPIELTVPVIWTPPHFVRTEEEILSLAVFKKTGGRVEININQFGELGLTGAEALTEVEAGTYQIMEFTDGYAVGDDPYFNWSGLPGLLFTIDDGIKASKAMKDLDDKMVARFNAISLPLGFVQGGLSIFTKKPLRTIDDLKGLKIRVYSKTQVDAFKRLGAAPNLIPWAEAPAALQQGVVDAVITGTSSGVGVGFGDVTKYNTTFPQINRVKWIANKDFWDSLPTDLQDVIWAEAKTAGERMQAQWKKEESDLRGVLAGGGIELVEPSPDFVRDVTTKLRPMWDEWAKSATFGEEALDRIFKALGR